MASPNYDALHVEFSKRLDDVVAAATSNGDVWSSVQRDIPLNEACRRLMMKYWKKVETDRFSEAWDFFRSLITSEGQAMTANAIALSSYTGGVFKILSALNSSTIVKELPQEWVDDVATLSLMPWYDSGTNNQYFYIDAGSLTNVGGGATDTITLRYIKNWTNLTASNATDIPIPSRYFHEVLDLAISIANEDMATQESLQRAMVKQAMVDKEIG